MTRELTRDLNPRRERPARHPRRATPGRMIMQDIELTNVSPETASAWLLSNTHNRNLRQPLVLAYAADMANGDWRWNGETIKFAEDGTLLDGQHRLAAIVEANTTMQMLVVRGLANEAQETVDTGSKRSLSDLLKLRGERQPNLLAAVVRRAHVWARGGRAAPRKGKYQPTTTQLLVTLEKHPELREITVEAKALAEKIALPGSIIGLGIWLFGELSPEDSAFFFARLADFQGLVKGDPIYELRLALDRVQSAQHEWPSETMLMALMIKAWNAYRDGKKIAVLTYRPGGARPEQFPEPH